MAFIVEQLKRNPKVEYATVLERARAKRLTVYPIMYGRAQALLGLVKMSPRGSGKKARAAKRGPGRPPKNGRRGRRGRRAARGSHDPLSAVKNLVASVRDTERSNDDLRRTLGRIRELIDGTL